VGNRQPSGTRPDDRDARLARHQVTGTFLASAEPFEHQGHALAAGGAYGLEPELFVVELQTS
jgi:hypothetical protein